MATTSDRDDRRDAPLADLLDGFREAVSDAADRSLRAASAGARAGTRPAYAVDGLDVELAVGINWTSDRKVRLLFDPPPNAVSKVRFRVSALPVSAIHAPHLDIRRVFDPDAIPGRHEFVVIVRDEANAAVNFAELRVSATRSDREGQTSGPLAVRAGLDGAVRIIVNTIGATVAVEGDLTVEGGPDQIPLPAKTADGWHIIVECQAPPISERIEVHNTTRRRRAR